MKLITSILLFISTFNTSFAQEKYLTKNGSISFFSHSPAEDIKADNKQVLSIINTANGEIAIAILMKSFHFKKSLMQEHFNENYVESDKFPKATFKGAIIDYKNISKSGTQTITIKGNLTLHGVTNQVKTQAIINWKDAVISLEGKFSVNVADYNIDIPSVVKNNIAKSIEISFKLNHKPYK